MNTASALPLAARRNPVLVAFVVVPLVLVVADVVLGVLALTTAPGAINGVIGIGVLLLVCARFFALAVRDLLADARLVAYARRRNLW